ncbi:hypothetical protein [Pseudofrankia inefficax]|uniref:Uncharacterized protein n=1 Tax=Pseudofrankia inefficax (strain DSM 45817 / CECT 9037 / DDB 130130 / EuI1c) TaxID=298654 RepID=E3IX46_PSEI1|nr:hypothetical protein [Pseudofrankia inefficax]ADP83818.1 hypothetical protein FraEuI1c_5834 [Pseudofrankia inefficax]
MPILHGHTVAVSAVGDSNPVNAGSCPQHGPYSGLICTSCITTLPTLAAPDATGAAA